MSLPSRKQDTYANKRNRRILSASESSPPQDSDHHIPYSQASARPLKRPRRSSNPEVFFPSKTDISAVNSPVSPSTFETPCPSALTEEQKFKLKSSRGLPMHPDEFSPLPTTHAVRSRRTSSNMHKENVSYRAPKKLELDPYLDSPFNSRPNSARPSPQKRACSSNSTKQLPKCTLSDTNYNPNIFQSASTASSPAHSPTRIRRPSAPSPPRPGTWVPKETIFGDFDFDFHSALSSAFSLPMNEIDFNRPPSSLSFYGDLDADLLDDAQAFSTPAKTNHGYSTAADEDTDDDFGDEENERTITVDTMDVDSPSRMKDAPTSFSSPYSSFSPPSPSRRPQERAYIRSPSSSSEDFDMYDDISLGLGLRLAPLVSNKDEHWASVLHNDSRKPRDGDLKELFEGLALAPKSRFPNHRTRSLDSPSSPAGGDSPSKPKGRDRRGTIRASDFPKHAFVPPRRTRSGTVIGPAAQSSHAGAPTNAQTESIGEVSEDEELSGWCSDGWEVAAPPSPMVSRKLLWTPRDPESTRSPDAPQKSLGLLPSPVLQRAVWKRKGRESVHADEDEEEDEL